MININQKHYDEELRQILSTTTTRIFFWRIITEDCRLFEDGYQHNATAYSLLARQEIGKHLLNDAKRISPENVFKAEQEYNALMEQYKKQNELTEENN
jgi:hypothetical protein